MNITEVRVELAEHATLPLPRVLAYCCVTFDDCFVVRNFKLVETVRGVILANPSRKVEDHCKDCGRRGPVIASWCGGCGSRQEDHRAARGEDGRQILHCDIAHPVNKQFRAVLEDAIRGAYARELAAPFPGGIHAFCSGAVPTVQV